MELQSTLIILRELERLLALAYGIWFKLDLGSEAFNLWRFAPRQPEANRKGEEDTIEDRPLLRVFELRVAQLAAWRGDLVLLGRGTAR